MQELIFLERSRMEYGWQTQSLREVLAIFFVVVRESIGHATQASSSLRLLRVLYEP